MLPGCPVQGSAQGLSASCFCMAFECHSDEHCPHRKCPQQSWNPTEPAINAYLCPVPLQSHPKRQAETTPQPPKSYPRHPHRQTASKPPLQNILTPTQQTNPNPSLGTFNPSSPPFPSSHHPSRHLPPYQPPLWPQPTSPAHSPPTPQPPHPRQYSTAPIHGGPPHDGDGGGGNDRPPPQQPTPPPQRPTHPRLGLW